MAAKERYEYYWIENRLISERLTRPDHTTAWRIDRETSTLVATIETRGRSFEVFTGPAATDERLAQCVCLYKGVYEDNSLLDYSATMPINVREIFRMRLNEAVSSVLKQWTGLAEETDLTGYLKGKLEEIEIEQDGWRIRIRSWTYNRNPKEARLGSDLGVIFDVLYPSGQRLIKAIWYQAKIIDEQAGKSNSLADLAEQIAKMRTFTKESYILYYTKKGMLTANEISDDNWEPFSDNIVDGAICRRGDRDHKVIALTADIKDCLTCFITWPKAR